MLFLFCYDYGGYENEHYRQIWISSGQYVSGKLGKSSKASSDRIQATGKAVVNLPGQGTSRIRQYAARLVMQRIIQSTEKPEKCCYGKYFVPGDF